MTVVLRTLSVDSSVDKSAGMTLIRVIGAGFLWVAKTLGSKLKS